MFEVTKIWCGYNFKLNYIDVKIFLYINCFKMHKDLSKRNERRRVYLEGKLEKL